MKKVVSIFLVLMMMFSLCACGQSVEDDILGSWAVIDGTYMLAVKFNDGAIEMAVINILDEDAIEEKGSYTIDEDAKTINANLDGKSVEFKYSYDENDNFKLYYGDLELEKQEKE